jgi:hypothetical protein
MINRLHTRREPPESQNPADSPQSPDTNARVR